MFLEKCIIQKSSIIIMKKIIVLVVFALLFSSLSYAQTAPIKTKESQKALSGEVYLGIGMPVYSVGSVKSTPRYMAGFELRYRFLQSPWDIGFGSRVGAFKRTYNEGYPVYVSSEHYLAADYNLKINPKLVFFAGIEGGVSIAYDMSRYNSTANSRGVPGVATDLSAFYAPKRVSPYFAPRIGIEAWNRLRCTIAFDVSDKGNSNVNFRIGYVF